MPRYIIRFLTLLSLALLASLSLSAQENPIPDANANADKKIAENKSMENKRDIPTPTSYDNLNKSDINHYIDAKEVTPLLAGPDDFITLIQTDTTSNSKGVAILLADWQQTATNPRGLNYLRNKLPQQGWTTISIQPPSKPLNYPSMALIPTDQVDENKKTLAAYQEKLMAIMTTVMEKAKSYPGIFIVITEGSHAALVTELYQQDKVSLPSALIVLSSYMINEADDIHYAKSLAQSNFPVLDLYLTRDNALALTSAPQRLTQANKEMKADFRQRQLNNIIPSYYPEKNLLKELNGWLKSIGW